MTARPSLFGSPRALGRSAFLLSFPVGIVATLAATRTPFSSAGVFVTWLSIGVLGHAALGVVLVFGNLAIRRVRVSARTTQVVVVVVTVVAGAARGGAIGWFAQVWGLPATATTGVRTLSSALIFSAWLVVVGAVLAATDRYTAEVTALLDELLAREVQLKGLDPSVSHRSADVAATRVAESVKGLGQLLTAGAHARDYQRTARLITTAVDERLRPLSHEMWFNAPQKLHQPGRLPRFVARTLQTPVPYRRALPLMMLFLIVNSYVWHAGPIGIVQGVLAGLLAVLIVVPLTRWESARPALANSMMYALLAVIPLPVATFLTARLTGANEFEPVAFVAGIGMPTAFWLGAAAQTVAGDRASTIADLRARIHDPEWDAHVAQLQRHASEFSEATFLHNTIQSRLTAAAIQLHAAGQSSDIARAEAAVELAISAVTLASHPAAEREPTGLVDRLSTFALAWKGIADVVLDLEGYPLAALGVAAASHDHPRWVAWLLASDAVEECVANSIRHGKARSVHVECREVADAVEVVVRDDGSWLGSARLSSPSAEDALHPAGGGFTWIHQVTAGAWTVEQRDSGTTVRLRIRLE